ncbi:hypothetical protein [Alkaliphilus sp. B6464]|uniref:hypothetical protein n=1 Tax=Alkaliphilus sp. B6464 TaxID=2731219 RepID=UPI001BAE127C|nr:hypothetical protein [Alkaliphilus sp. B6464]QUH21109.1 hypothetical protein HYG84_15280 [Alkaliphilus sp. B6464]
MTVTGFCPTLEGEHSIEVEYINASTLEERIHIKGLFTCSVVSFGGCCSVAKNCPLYKSAPEKK